MQKYFNNLVDSRGNVLQGVSVRVYVAGSNTLASLYSDDGVTPTTNPQVTDSIGYFSFFVITGSYDLKVSGPHVSTYWIRDVLISDEVADYASSAGSSLIGFVQAGTGAVARTVQDKGRDWLNVNDFAGVDPTGVADSSAGFANAIAQASASGRVLQGAGTYRLDSKTVFTCDCDLWAAQLNVLGTLPVAIEISTGSASNPTDNLVGKTVRLGYINNTTKPATGWTSQGVGVRGVNLLTCDVSIRRIRGFAVGKLCTSYQTGYAYSDVCVLYYENNQVNLKLQPADAVGFVNENNFYGGRYHHLNGEGTAVAGTRQIQLLPYDIATDTTSWPNNNVFYKPSLEGNVPEFHAEIAGDSNHIKDARWEATTPKVRYTGHASNTSKTSKNMISGGYNSDLITFSTSGLTLGGDLTHPRKKIHSGFGLNDIVRNTAGDITTTPTRRVFSSGKELLTAVVADTDWTVNEYANGLEAKRSGDAAARVFLDFQNGRIYFGDGTGAPTKYIGNGAFGMASSSHILPTTTDTYYNGEAGSRWQRTYTRDLYADFLYFGTTFSGAYIRTYTTSPEGSVTAPVGALVLNINGGASTTLYVKQSGSGNTGWVAK